MRKMLDQAVEMSHEPFEMSNIKEGFNDLLNCQINLLECQAKNHRMQGPIEDAILELQEENELRKLEISANTELVRNISLSFGLPDQTQINYNYWVYLIQKCFKIFSLLYSDFCSITANVHILAKVVCFVI